MLTILLVSDLMLPPPVRAQIATPGTQWEVVNDLEAAGWEPDQLAEARSIADSLGTAAYMLVEGGRAVTTYGDVTHTFRTHSVRKSLLSALYGASLPEIRPYLDRPLSELAIDDYPGLKPAERTATLRHLLLSRSGVYLPAAYENAAFDRFRPERTSHRPGTFWFYSNWDFNVAGTVFQLLTGTNIFAAFRDRIARPLGMQDFDLDAMEWRYDRRSWHPAYLFRLSTRDLARFGLLYLRGGTWGGRQIVPQTWIDRTTRWHSDVARPDGTPIPGAGYGMMWWVHRPPDVPMSFGGRVFSAEGTGSQVVLILPALDLVFVHRTDTDLPTERYRSVSQQEVFRLLAKILEARLAH